MIFDKTFIVIDDLIHINFKWYDGKKKFDWDWDNCKFKVKYSDELLERLKNKKGYEYIAPVKNPKIPTGEYREYERGSDHAMEGGSFNDYWGLRRKAGKGYF